MSNLSPAVCRIGTRLPALETVSGASGAYDGAMIQLEFVGAAQTVTGSMHLLRTKNATLLLDCGLYQGRRREAYERNSNLPIDVRRIDAIVLSHAHIDHSGALPLVAKRGYRGPIFATPATRDLCAVMLEDAAMIQEQDAKFINKAIDRDRAPMDPVEPLYDMRDVIDVLRQTISLPYHQKLTVADGVTLTFLDAGHVLGSAITVLDVDDDGEKKRIVFTGDLGRRDMPILRDPESVGGAQVLVTESTYGDRLHSPIQEMDDELATVIARTHERGGKVIVPSFALERAQEVIYALKRLRSQGRLPSMPVYVDSPLTVKVTDVFRMHPECYDEDARAIIQSRDSPFDFDALRYVADVEESKQIDRSTDPCIVISASGMCETGRILHHLKATVESEKNTVVIVGFQAQHTLGRRLVEKRTRVRIFGLERERRCDVVVLNGFSAHADQADLIAFAEDTRKHGPLRKVALVHGEPKAQEVLRGLLASRGFPDIVVPVRGDTLDV